MSEAPPPRTPRRAVPVRAGLVALATWLAGGAREARADGLLERLVASTSRSAAGAPAREPAAHRLQVALGVVVRAPREGEPAVVARETYRADAEYVYPASAIKLCLAVAALERAAAYAALPGLEGFGEGRAVTYLDPRRPPVSLPLATDLRAALVVSDNDAANRLYDFVGSDELHARMHALGLSSFAFRHRLATLPSDDVATTPALDLDVGARGWVHVGPKTRRRAIPPSHVPGLVVGDVRVEGGQSLPGGMDFSAKNRVALVDLQRLLVKVVRPETVTSGVPALGDVGRARLESALEALPSSTGAPLPLGPEQTDVAHKPLLPGLLKVVPRDALRYLSKGGRAYGFSVENAYVEDRRTGRAFFLAIAVYTNQSGIVGDDTYEYRTVADPWFAELAEAVARAVFDAPAP